MGYTLINVNIHVGLQAHQGFDTLDHYHDLAMWLQSVTAKGEGELKNIAYHSVHIVLIEKNMDVSESIFSAHLQHMEGQNGNIQYP